MIWTILYFAFGAILFVHCSRAAIGELKSGRAIGFNKTEYNRISAPIAFWAVTAGNFAAGLLGLVFIALGYLNATGALQ